MARQYRLLAVSISLYHPPNAVLLLSLAVLYKWHILTNGYLALLFALSPKLDIDNVITLCPLLSMWLIYGPSVINFVCAGDRNRP